MRVDSYKVFDGDRDGDAGRQMAGRGKIKNIKKTALRRYKGKEGTKDPPMVGETKGGSFAIFSRRKDREARAEEKNCNGILAL